MDGCSTSFCGLNLCCIYNCIWNELQPVKACAIHIRACMHACIHACVCVWNSLHQMLAMTLSQLLIKWAHKSLCYTPTHTWLYTLVSLWGASLPCLLVECRLTWQPTSLCSQYKQAIQVLRVDPLCLNLRASNYHHACCHTVQCHTVQCHLW